MNDNALPSDLSTCARGPAFVDPWEALSAAPDTLGHQRLARRAGERRPPTGGTSRRRHQRLPAAPPVGRLPARRIVDQPGPRLGGRALPPLLPDRAPAHRQHAEQGAGPAHRPAPAGHDRPHRPLRLAVRRPRAGHRHHGGAAARGHARHLARGDGDAVAGADLAGVLHGHRPAAGRAAGEQRPGAANRCGRCSTRCRPRRPSCTSCRW